MDAMETSYFVAGPDHSAENKETGGIMKQKETLQE